MTFRFIDQHQDQWPVRLLCETLEVSPAGYYAWRQRSTSDQEQRRAALVVEIKAIHAQVKARYGSPRLHAELVARGQTCRRGVRTGYGGGEIACTNSRCVR